MHVPHVGRHLSINTTGQNMNDYTQGRNLTTVSGVVKDLPIQDHTVSTGTRHGVKMLKAEIERRKRQREKLLR
jgi:hypothetical protein